MSSTPARSTRIRSGSDSPFWLIVPPNMYEWQPFATFDQAVDAISGIDCIAVYEAEPRDHMAPLLSDVSEKAARAWLEKNQGEVQFGEWWGDNDAPGLVQKHADDALAELFDGNEIDATVTAKDQRVHLSERL